MDNRTQSLTWVVAVALAPACVSRVIVESSGDDAADDGDRPDCADNDFGTEVPSTVRGSTVGQADSASSECGGRGSPDASATFTAPFTGTFIFDTGQSAFDTVLYVLDGACEGPPLACNDDGADLSSLVSVQLRDGQTVTAIVDGFEGEGGDYVLSVSGSDSTARCVAEPIRPESLPAVYSGTTEAAAGVIEGTCGGAGPEQIFEWVAPNSGLFTFDTLMAPFDSVLYIRDGDCNGPEIVCNDDAGQGLGSAVTTALSAGQRVSIVVDGLGAQSGRFDLTIDEIGGACPDEDLGSETFVFVAGNTAGGGNSGALSCGGEQSSDLSFLWTAPVSGGYTFSASADGGVVLGLRTGCGGPEMACTADVNGRVALFSTFDAGQQALIVVDGISQSVAFELAVEQSACDSVNLGADFPVSVSGALEGQASKFQGSCADSGGPDAAFLWRVPATGTYTFDTVGSNFDTVLYLLREDCTGPEFACDDDGTGSTQSRLTRQLDEGEAIVIVVDGFAGEVGNYQLNIQ